MKDDPATQESGDIVRKKTKSLVRVALVDDDVDIMNLLEIVVRDLMHYDYDRYFDGESALEGILSDPPDLVILDILMPNINGLQVLAIIRKVYPNLQVLMLTAINEHDQAIEAGANAYLQKPFVLHELRQEIELLIP